MKKDNPAVALGAACLVVLLLGCVCSATAALLAFDTVGGAWDWAARLFRRRPEQVTLYWVLRNDAQESFTFGPDCAFEAARGTRIDSGLEAGDGFAADLGREEVIQAAAAALQGDRFQVREGSVSLDTGTPVSTSILEEERVSLSYSETVHSGEAVSTHSLSGVVIENRFQGSFSLDVTRSEVVNGQGIEQSLTAAAELSCPIVWAPE